MCASCCVVVQCSCNNTIQRLLCAPVTAVRVDPECGGVARRRAAWGKEIAGNKVSDVSLTMLC